MHATTTFLQDAPLKLLCILTAGHSSRQDLVDPLTQISNYEHKQTKQWSTHITLCVNKSTLQKIFLKLTFTWSLVKNKNKNHQINNNNNNNKTRRANSQMIRIRHTGLIHCHLNYIINHQEHLSYFTQLFNRMIAHVLAFPSLGWPWVNIKVIQTGIKR